MKTILLLVFAAQIADQAQALKDCDSATITAKINEMLKDASVVPCVSEVGADCFSPTGTEEEACTKKIIASKKCEAAWPAITTAFGTINPPCKYGDVSTSNIGQLKWADYVSASSQKS